MRALPVLLVGCVHVGAIDGLPSPTAPTACSPTSSSLELSLHADDGQRLGEVVIVEATLTNCSDEPILTDLRMMYGPEPAGGLYDIGLEVWGPDGEPITPDLCDCWCFGPLPSLTALAPGEARTVQMGLNPFLYALKELGPHTVTARYVAYGELADAATDHEVFVGTLQDSVRFELVKARPSRIHGPIEGYGGDDLYPPREGQRPLVLPARMVEIGVAATMSDAGAAVHADASVGISDILELGATAGVEVTSTLEAPGAIEMRARALVYDGGEVDVAPGIRVDVPTRPSVPLALGADATTRLALPGYWLPSFLRVGDGAVQLTLGDGAAIAFVGAIGVGFQLGDSVALLLDAEVARLDVGLAARRSHLSGIWSQPGLSAALQITPRRTVDIGLRGRLRSVVRAGDTLSAGAFATCRF